MSSGEGNIKTRIKDYLNQPYAEVNAGEESVKAQDHKPKNLVEQVLQAYWLGFIRTPYVSKMTPIVKKKNGFSSEGATQLDLLIAASAIVAQNEHFSANNYTQATDAFLAKIFADDLPTRDELGKLKRAFHSLAQKYFENAIKNTENISLKAKEEWAGRNADRFFSMALTGKDQEGRMSGSGEPYDANTIRLLFERTLPLAKINTLLEMADELIPLQKLDTPEVTAKTEAFLEEVQNEFMKAAKQLPINSPDLAEIEMGIVDNARGLEMVAEGLQQALVVLRQMEKIIGHSQSSGQGDQFGRG